MVVTIDWAIIMRTFSAAKDKMKDLACFVWRELDISSARCVSVSVHILLACGTVKTETASRIVTALANAYVRL